VFRFVLCAIAAIFRPRALLIAENLCLRQQLLVLHRRRPRPCPGNADRGFWILASRWFGGWHHPLRIVKPETVLRWQRQGWKVYWDVAVTSGSEGRSPRDSPGASRPHSTHGHRKSPVGSKADPSRVGKVGLQGIGKNRSQVYAFAFLSGTLSRLAKVPEADRWPPRFLIHDRDSRYGMTFDNRLRRLGIKQNRTPYRSPRANAVAERWIKSARSECLDHLFIFSEAGLRRDLSSIPFVM
jgi:putative transposase